LNRPHPGGARPFHDRQQILIATQSAIRNQVKTKVNFAQDLASVLKVRIAY
jgi:hypothetical protein